MVRWLAAQQPELEQWACSDTAFHATLPPEATTYAIPADWRRQGLPAGRRQCSHFPLIESPCVLPDRPF